MGVILIRRNLVSKSSRDSMDFGTAKLFSPNDLASSHLHQRRTTKVSLGLVFNKDCVIRQSGMIRSTCGGSPEYDCTRWLSVLRTDSKIAEELASLVEDSKLLR